ncbi:MAG: BON domain-containing protein [Gammaproteobacteria bacterium]|nr:BON domain-containing protein [Gammaproteobacteria bacterium]MBU6509432.1 BON domain-containing protein [Gammaproteobacteria bacterium]MDE1983708.1 BON domain-containing protein [Gammaproteobacteria bacterium]MDE2107908.1 BON domain-containing protein [Gammaproteobacteria bacterium]MDE2460210.1 BON domain-containing protein [Gammaproteobacteria bacterium]
MLKASLIPLLSLLAVLSLVSMSACSSNKPMTGATVGSFADDSYLTSVVKAKLLGDTGLKAFHIHVTTKAQVVTLTGTLPNTALRDEAVQVAKGVGGVKGVIDDIQIGPGK